MGELIEMFPEPYERNCWDCVNSTSGQRGTYCHEFNEWIFDEADAASDCEAFES